MKPKPDPGGEFERFADAQIQRLEKLRESLLRMIEPQIPDIQKSDKRLNYAELEPSKLKENFRLLAARMFKLGWVADTAIDDEQTLVSKLTETGKKRFGRSAEVFVNAVPQFFYSKGPRPGPESVIISKRDQTLLFMELAGYFPQLGAISEGEFVALYGFLAWYAQKRADKT